MACSKLRCYRFTIDKFTDQSCNTEVKNDEELKRERPVGLFHVPEGLDQKTLGQMLMRLGRSMAGLPSSNGFKITSDKNECQDWTFGEGDDEGED